MGEDAQSSLLEIRKMLDHLPLYEVSVPRDPFRAVGLLEELMKRDG
jgi:hypothetical protein